ncbi:MAG TPA: TetR family transcriptional regulator [Actinopolymorphaceae bacterium]|jgi:TetR/AcrR family transcriptional repressor of nem operon
MARTKEFDPDEVLERALDLFWRKGYEATSMADLVEHLGIGRASMYATFGTKHELYLKALERYIASRDPDPVRLLSQPGPVLPAIRHLVRLYAAEAAADQEGRGCMVVNAAAELAPRDRVVTRRIEAGWNTIEVALRSALTRAQAQGELDETKDPAALASFLFVVLQGIRLVGKVESSPDRLRHAAEQALAVLE